MTVVEQIKSHLDAEEAVLFQERWDFIKLKTEPARGSILKMRDRPEEELCRATQEEEDRKRTPGFLFLTAQLAMEGEVDFAEKIQYFLDFEPARRPFSSAERYEEEFKKVYYAQVDEIWLKSDFPWNYYKARIDCHDLEPVLRDGVRLCFDNPRTRHIDFELRPRNPSVPACTVEAAWVLLNLGLYERAEKYLEVLRGYQKILRGRTRPDLAHAKRFAAITDCLELLIAAKRAEEPETARRHAARAILAHLGGIVDNFADKTYAMIYMCNKLALSICIAIDFDFDPQWARRCGQALFYSITGRNYHAVFFKLREWGAWARLPEEAGWLPWDRVREIREEVRQKYPFSYREPKAGKSAAK